MCIWIITAYRQITYDLFWFRIILNVRKIKIEIFVKQVNISRAECHSVGKYKTFSTHSFYILKVKTKKGSQLAQDHINWKFRFMFLLANLSISQYSIKSLSVAYLDNSGQTLEARMTLASDFFGLIISVLFCCINVY